MSARTQCFLSLCLVLIAWIGGAAEEKMSKQAYTVDLTELNDRMSQGDSSPALPPDFDKAGFTDESVFTSKTDGTVLNWIARELNVQLLPGSQANLEAIESALVVRTTPKHHDELQKALRSAYLVPLTIHVRLRTVEFDAELIDKLDRRSRGGVTPAEIVQAWRNGHGTVLDAASIQCAPDVEAKVEGQESVVYPMEKWGPPMQYGAVETREIGVSLHVQAKAFPQRGVIELQVSLERSVSKGKRRNVASEIQSLLPVFGGITTKGRIQVEHGSTLVTGSSSSKDGKQRIYVLVSACFVDGDGKTLPLPKRDPSTKRAPRKGEAP